MCEYADGVTELAMKYETYVPQSSLVPFQLLVEEGEVEVNNVEEQVESALEKEVKVKVKEEGVEGTDLLDSAEEPSSGSLYSLLFSSLILSYLLFSSLFSSLLFSFLLLSSILSKSSLSPH